MINHAKPIPEVLKDERVSPSTKRFLGEVPQIKTFGEKNGLKATSSYSDYVKLDRDAAVWVVSACEPLQFRVKEWKFPVVGSFPYLGWFDLDNARHYARELKAEGYDVDVRPARAYSTLGWFKDAILSTMIPNGPDRKETLGDLVNVVIHESVHATVYIKGQTYFNESLASFVADGLTKAYLEQTYGTQSPELKAYLDSKDESEKIEKLFHDTHLKLAAIYQSTLTDAEKLEKKKHVLEDLKAAAKLRRDVNNATLIQYKAYHTGEKELQAVFERCRKDWFSFNRLFRELKPGVFSAEQEEEFGRAIENWPASLSCAAPLTAKKTP